MERRGDNRGSARDPVPRHRAPYRIDRRTFVAGATATLVAAPAAWAQDRVAPIRLAVRSGFTPDEMTESRAPRYRAFFGELRRLGLIEGENLIVERWSTSGVPQSERPDFHRTMVASRPDVIFSLGANADVREATATIPIVFVGSTDPVAQGFAVSLARPGGNVTEFAAQPGWGFRVKLLQLLREAVPGPEPVAFLVVRGFDQTGTTITALREGAAQIGITLKPAFIEEPVDEQSIARAFAALPEWPNRVMYVNQGSAYVRNIGVIAAKALKAGIPTIFHLRAGADAGLLMSYGRDINAQYADAAGYVVRVARGEDPAEMPIQLPSRFDFVVNLKTAKALGLTLPDTIMYRATEFIE